MDHLLNCFSSWFMTWRPCHKRNFVNYGRYNVPRLQIVFAEWRKVGWRVGKVQLLVIVETIARHCVIFQKYQNSSHVSKSKTIRQCQSKDVTKFQAKNLFMNSKGFRETGTGRKTLTSFLFVRWFSRISLLIFDFYRGFFFGGKF